MFKVVSAKDILGDMDYVVYRRVLIDTRSWVVIDRNEAIFPWVLHTMNTVKGRPWTNAVKFQNGDEVSFEGWDDLPIVKIDQCFMLGSNPNYYHFTVDYLANMLFYDLDDELHQVPLLVGGDELWQTELMASYNTLAPVVLNSRNVCLLQVDTLFLPRKCFDYEGRLVRKDYPSWVSEKVRGIIPSQKTTGLLYVSRASARSRRIRNENELMQSLSLFGFERIVPEFMTVRDQIAVFKGARIVVGPTGAAFTNLAYSSKGTQLIELMPGESWRPPQIEYLCNAVGIVYHQIVCSGRFEDEHVDVDINSLMDKLHALIS